MMTCKRLRRHALDVISPLLGIWWKYSNHQKVDPLPVREHSAPSDLLKIGYPVYTLWML